MKRFEAIQTHCGPYKKYGDFFYEWEVKTECTEEETLEYCFSNLYKRRVPSSAEWHKNNHSCTPIYYFHGYYDLHKINGGFKFTICEPLGI